MSSSVKAEPEPPLLRGSSPETVAGSFEDVACFAVGASAFMLTQFVKPMGWLVKEPGVNYFAMQIIKSFIFSFV